MAPHVQWKPGHVRPPQVHITYDVELGDTIETKELPFVLGVLADLSGKPEEPLPRFEERKFIEIDRESFDAFMRGIRPRLAFRVDNKLTNDDTKLGVELRFSSMEDFQPEQIVNQIEPLRKLLEIRRQLTALLPKIGNDDQLHARLFTILDNTELLRRLAMDLEPSPDQGESITEIYPVRVERGQAQIEVYEPYEGLGLLDRIITESRLGRDEGQREQSRQQIATLVGEVSQGSIRIHKDLKITIAARIADIDALLSRQLNEILHASDLQRLEGTWRGLYYLVHRSETSSLLKIRVLNVSKQELLRDLTEASALHQSAFFKKVYEEEYGTFGGTPYGALIGDYEFGNRPQDVALLELISHVAAAAYAPFIAAASSQLLHLDSFTELSRPRDLAKSFDTVEYAKWHSFRNSEDSRYVGLTLPHLLMRLPYGPDTVLVEAFNFVEAVDGTDHSVYLWSNAAYAFGSCLTMAFARYHWCAALLGVAGGGLVEGLPMHTYVTDDGEVRLKCPTEIAITDRCEEELSALGFIPIVYCKGTDYAAFFSAQSCQRAKTYSIEAANTDARLSTQLSYVLAFSRFVHYLKAIMRDKIGSFRNKTDCEDYLNRWLASYVLLDDNGSAHAQAQNPLREARVEVSEVPGRTGIYRAEIFLRPHFQMDERTASHHTITELPIAGRESPGRRCHGF